MADLGAILDAIEVQLDTIAGLHAHSEMPDTVVIPAAWVDPSSLRIEFHSDFDGGVTIQVDVVAAIAAVEAGLALGARRCWPYMISIPAAIESGGDLGGVVDSVKASVADRMTSYASGGVEYLGFKVAVEIFA